MKFQTVLYTPGNRPDRIQKAWHGGADMVVADLEDAVPPAEKAAARQAVCELLRQPRGPAARAVRINVGKAGDEDVAALLGAMPDIVFIPKAEDPAAVRKLVARLEDIPVAIILETAKGVLHAEALCNVPGVVAVLFGAEDLAAEVGIIRSASNAEVAVPRALVPIAAATAGIPAVDMVTSDLQDVDRFRREAAEARALGYQGKMCLHPTQVAACKEAFAPTAAEVAWAKKVVAAAADIPAGGVVVVDGRMIDVPLIQQAKRLLS